MSDSELIKLYSKQILSLAASIPHLHPLTDAQARFKARSPLCGSTVTVELTAEKDVVNGFSQNVKACALGQASSALFGAQVIGMSKAEIQAGRDAVATMLMQDGPAPKAPFDGYEVLSPARAFKNRHASILLPFDATLGALAEIPA